jgi:hypothetical protein
MPIVTLSAAAESRCTRDGVGQGGRWVSSTPTAGGEPDRLVAGVTAGVIANRMSGRHFRRLVASASVFPHVLLSTGTFGSPRRSCGSRAAAPRRATPPELRTSRHARTTSSAVATGWPLARPQGRATAQNTNRQTVAEASRPRRRAPEAPSRHPRRSSARLLSMAWAVTTVGVATSRTGAEAPPPRRHEPDDLSQRLDTRRLPASYAARAGQDGRRTPARQCWPCSAAVPTPLGPKSPLLLSSLPPHSA